MALEYEDLPQMQSLTPEPDSDTSSLKDDSDGGCDDDADLGIKPASPCKNDGKNETIITSDCGRISPARACSPLYSYNKYDLKSNRQSAEPVNRSEHLVLNGQKEDSGVCCAVVTDPDGAKKEVTLLAVNACCVEVGTASQEETESGKWKSSTERNSYVVRDCVWLYL
ncbi:hypothetical protein quinque_012194 [Culex quinquefasciatus]